MKSSKIKKITLAYVGLMALTAITAFAGEGKTAAEEISAPVAAVIQNTESSQHLHNRVRGQLYDMKRSFIEVNHK